MKRVGTLLIAMAVVAALLAIPLGVSAAADDTESESATAGEQLGGVLGVQGASLDGELSDRTFGQKIATAESDEARAEIIAERLTEIETRIADHEARLAALEAQREAGEISEGRYSAQVATLEAERGNTERAADRAGDTARGLPESVLTDRGINVDRIDELRANASQLGGPAASETAREIAGENVSTPIASDRSGDRGAPVDRSSTDALPADRETPDQDWADSHPKNESAEADSDESERTVQGTDESDADRLSALGLFSGLFFSS